MTLITPEKFSIDDFNANFKKIETFLEAAERQEDDEILGS